MRIFTPETTVKRNLKIGQYTFGGGMLLLLAAFALNLYALSQSSTSANTRLVSYAFGAFLIGFTLTNIGTVYNNRWGRRSDKGLSDALKGLDKSYSLYNYRLGAQHVLVGPHGVLVLVPKYQTGVITFVKGKWQNPGAPRGFLGLGSRDSLGNPTAEAGLELDSLHNVLKKKLPDTQLEPQVAVVFMHPRAELETKDAPLTTLHVKQLKEYVRRLPKGPGLNAEAQKNLEEKLGLTSEDK